MNLGSQLSEWRKNRLLWRKTKQRKQLGIYMALPSDANSKDNPWTKLSSHSDSGVFPMNFVTRPHLKSYYYVDGENWRTVENQRKWKKILWSRSTTRSARLPICQQRSTRLPPSPGFSWLSRFYVTPAAELFCSKKISASGVPLFWASCSRSPVGYCSFYSKFLWPQFQMASWRQCIRSLRYPEPASRTFPTSCRQPIETTCWYPTGMWVPGDTLIVSNVRSQ